ncbi:MAG: DUF1800 domain-containing protein [Pedosphaera sp.]|nr:DUF1800 domain-containing protein [Pedosphaera sp.]MSS99857.1 DUF1800 domain-containing protein [Pedosphaera sp.]
MNVSRRKFLQAGSAAALAATAGCNRAPSDLLPFLKPASPDSPFQPPQSAAIDLVSHCINRLSFGARPGDYSRVRKLGATEAEAVAAYIEEQLDPDRIPDKLARWAVRRCETLDGSVGELFEYKERLLLEELTRGALLRAVFSERQLFEVMVQFWTDHFNIAPSKGDCRWLKTADDRDVIRRHAFGHFPAMLRASALSPAMLWYLDGRANRRRNADEKPNENYARELLELHTLGVHGGYSQQDVMEVARCLTGWTVRGTKESKFRLGKVEFNPHLHDKEAKTVLDQHIPAIPPNLSREEQERLGSGELDLVLDIIALHPATAKYLATKLCRRFIAEEAPAAAVAAVAEAFLKSSGNLRDTLRALFATPEFLAARGGKFKRPFHFITSALRATGAETDARRPLTEFLDRMGHAPFQYPTPDGYPEEAAPWMGTLLWRWNFAVAFGENKIKGTKLDTKALKLRADGEAGLLAHLLGRKPSEEELRASTESGAPLSLALASPAFQRF